MSTIFGCSTTVIMERSDAISVQPELLISTDGTFGGFGREGTFNIAGLYQGKYSRNASTSTWFQTIETKNAEMIAELTRNDNGKTWTIICHGGGTGYNLGVFSLGGSKQFICKVGQNGIDVGEFQMEPASETIELSMALKERGFIRYGNTHFNVQSVHMAEGAMVSTETPLGYRFTRGEVDMAAVQTQGTITLQMLPNLTSTEIDTLILGTVASAFSWRPAE
ncbi:hypothetical protein QWZ04_21845 [Vibrio tapetis subsp. quintayensis]|uniref:hypothetical protein n=1 Tax=Vibrio tapetis TaxID=52443 RepID=UPI0025B5A0AD|nr:hypothetical protein [Vibrio tapetis]MDN3682952.1 hypothetical protein [Vibrio tapetis subsp. quintayensis]